jgi:hypothetical protein
MAKLSAKGRTMVGEIKYIRATRRYMSDGTVLENSGQGWKVRGKVKAGRDIAETYAKAKASHEAQLASRPALAAWHKAATQEPISRRWRLLLAISMMPDDVDGIYSTLAEGYDALDLTLDDVIELCRLHNAAYAEGKALADSAEIISA